MTCGTRLSRSSSCWATVTADPELLQQAGDFADQIADVLHRSICPDPPIQAQIRGDRILVASSCEDGHVIRMPVNVGGTPRLEFRVRLWCTWDGTGQYLAIDDSQVAVHLKDVNEPLLRVEYERKVPSAHLHVHAESAALAHLLTLAGVTDKLPKVQVLHLPVGGARFRPSVEDVIEFAITEMGADAAEHWEDAIAEGRDRWHWVQLKAALRDRLRSDPDAARDLRDLIDGLASTADGQLE